MDIVQRTDEEPEAAAVEPRAGRGQKSRRGEKDPKTDQSKTDHNVRGGGGGLERVTVNLIPRASRALEQATDLTGDSKTDSINRALQVYAYLEEVWSKGGAVLVEIDGQRTELKFF
jgi:hypothetical protein